MESLCSIILMTEQRSILKNVWREAPVIRDFSELQSVLRSSRDLDLTPLGDPFVMSGMAEAVTRIRQALEKKERIMIFGDFDADGVTSTIILVHGLRQLGAEISYRIPDRNTDSHGLKSHLIDEILSKNVGLMITCDCGINDAEEIGYATSQGLDVIVTDHHDPDETRFPTSATAVLNPKLESCQYPEKELSGAGIALKLMQALGVPNIDPLFEMAAIGLIADCVPLQGENRSIVQRGLTLLQKSSWPSFQKLFTRLEIDPDQINEETVGFQIAPRLNAASRIGNVLVASELFLGPEDKIDAYLDQLEIWNQQRKNLTHLSLEEAQPHIDPGKDFQFLTSKKWLPGIVGLLAGRYANELGVPVIAGTIQEDLFSASCRAPAGCSIIQALRSCDPELFHRLGGHDGAAGFQTSLKHIRDIQKGLETYFKAHPLPVAELQIEAYIHPQLCSLEVVDFLKTLRPFGVGNLKPLLGLKHVTIKALHTMGTHQNHLRILGSLDDSPITCTAFFAENLIPHLREGMDVDIIATMDENIWKGDRSVQLQLVDICES